MSENNKQTAVAGVILCAAILGSIAGFVFGKGSRSVVIQTVEGQEEELGGLIHNVQEEFSNGLKIGAGGTVVTKHVSGSTTVNPDSIAPGQTTTTVVSMTGVTSANTVAVGLTGDWSSASSSVRVSGVPGTDSVTLYYANTSGTAVNLSRTTFYVDAWKH